MLTLQRKRIARRRLLLAWALLCACVPAAARGQEIPRAAWSAGTRADTVSPYGVRQTWASRDKAMHFAVSGVAAGGLYAAGRAVGMRRRDAAVTSAVLVGAAGVLRELRDRSSAEPEKYFSEKDMLWNAAGIGAGILATELWMRWREER